MLRMCKNTNRYEVGQLFPDFWVNMHLSDSVTYSFYFCMYVPVMWHIPCNITYSLWACAKRLGNTMTCPKFLYFYFCHPHVQRALDIAGSSYTYRKWHHHRLTKHMHMTSMASKNKSQYISNLLERHHNRSSQNSNIVFKVNVFQEIVHKIAYQWKKQMCKMASKRKAKSIVREPAEDLLEMGVYSGKGNSVN